MNFLPIALISADENTRLPQILLRCARKSTFAFFTGSLIGMRRANALPRSVLSGAGYEAEFAFPSTRISCRVFAPPHTARFLFMMIMEMALRDCLVDIWLYKPMHFVFSTQRNFGKNLTDRLNGGKEVLSRFQARCN
jgi:hypothetical protein